MAVKEFNCNKLKRTFWQFTLKDKVDGDGNVVEKGRKIIVRMPQKQIFEAIKEIQDVKIRRERDTHGLSNHKRSIALMKKVVFAQAYSYL